MKIAVLGAGTWGTALAILLANHGHEVTIWSKLQKELSSLSDNRMDLKNLPGAVLPANVQLTENLESGLSRADLVTFAVASPYVRETAKLAAPYIPEGKIIVNVAKGIENNTLLTLSDVLKQELAGRKITVLSGPSHAEEVSRGVPTTCVVGAESKNTALFVQDCFMTDYFRVYTSPDVIGIELGGALKNVIALAAGIADGLGFGDNTKAALMTRGMAEISRLGIKMGGKIETFAGLSGVGDLFVTCASKHSRNRNAGYLIGRGAAVDDAMNEVKQIVEGVHSAKAALGLSKRYEVVMPIVEQVNLVLFENKSAKEAVMDLLLRDKTREYANLEW